MTFNKQELLREAGYEEGDFFPVIALGPGKNRSLSIADSTYNSSPDFWLYSTVLDNEIPTETPTVYIEFDLVQPGSGESVDIRLFDDDQKTTLAEVEGITNSRSVGIGPVTAPTIDTTKRSQLIIELRNDPGSNSSSLFSPKVSIGVTL